MKSKKRILALKRRNAHLVTMAKFMRKHGTSDASDTLRPRLEAAGGDPSRVLLLSTVPGLDTHTMALVERPFCLSDDLELLEQAIKRINARLVVLDPLMAVLGASIDSSRDQQI